MYRDELEAARDRIAALEDEIAQLRTGTAVDQKIAALEAELAELRRDQKREVFRHRGVRIAKRAGIAIVTLFAIVITKPAWNGLLEAASPGAAEQVYRVWCAFGSGQDCSYRGVAAWRRNDLATFERYSKRGCDRGNGQGCTNYAHCIKQRDAAQYTTILRKACDLGDAIGCNNLASDLSTHGDVEGSVKTGTRACDEGAVLGCANLAWFLLQAHRPEDAQRKAVEAARADGSLSNAHQNIAYALLAIGEDDEEAVRELRRATDAARVRRTDGEVEVFERPVTEEIRDSLKKLQDLYPNRRDRIEAMLKRENEWGGS